MYMRYIELFNLHFQMAELVVYVSKCKYAHTTRCGRKVMRLIFF